MFIKSKVTGYIYQVIAIDNYSKKYKINNNHGTSDEKWWDMKRFKVIEDIEPKIIDYKTSKEINIIKKEIEEIEKNIEGWTVANCDWIREHGYEKALEEREEYAEKRLWELSTQLEILESEDK